MKFLMSVFMFSILFVLSTSVFAQANEEDVKFPDRLYNSDTLYWFGVDFSSFKLTNKKKVGQEVELDKYLDLWREHYEGSVPNVKLGGLLGVKHVFDDKSFNETSFKTGMSQNWISQDRHQITNSQIEERIQGYTSENASGIGVTFIVENFYKDEPKVYGYFVWFDIATKKTIVIKPISGNPSTNHVSYGGFEITGVADRKKMKGMSGYWVQGMVDATIDLSIDYKDQKPKKEKQY